MLQALRQGLVRYWIVVLLCLVLGGSLFSLGYWLGERSMPRQLAQKGRPSYPPDRPWARDNGANPMQPGANLPANATPEMKEFLANRQTLMQKMAEMRQQNPSANGASDPRIIAQFREENKDLLARQQQLAQIIGGQQAANPPPMPPPLQFPPNATPQVKDFLTARDQLMRDQIAFMNQHKADDQQTRQAAMQQWRQQNASRFQALQQQAQAMAQTSQPAAINATTPATTTPPNK